MRYVFEDKHRLTSYLYILDEEHRPVPIDAKDVLLWAAWRERVENCIVKQEHVGNYLVSTVFLGVDGCMGLSSRAPLLFETMVFASPERGALDDYTERCSTWEEALLVHQAVCASVSRLCGER